MNIKNQKLKTFDLSIVIPAYREEKRIGKTLDSLSKYIKQNSIIGQKQIEVIVVAADSTDKTVDVATKKAALFDNFLLLKSGPRAGKGRDVRFGVLRASGNVIVYMDADLATPLKYLTPFYKTCISTGGIVVATRDLRTHHKNYSRMLLSNIGNLLFRLAGGLWIEDSQCGFKMFTREAANICFSKLEILGWGFDMEILAIAQTNKLPITSYRVNDWTHKPGGTFEDNIITNGLHSLGDLLLILSKRLSGRYKIHP